MTALQRAVRDLAVAVNALTRLLPSGAETSCPRPDLHAGPYICVTCHFKQQGISFP